MSTDHCIDYPSNWPETSKRIRERDNWRCCWCDSPVNLGVAHLNHHKDDNREENLLTLCWPCHSKYDRHTSANHPAKKAKAADTRKRKRNQTTERWLEVKRSKQWFEREAKRLRDKETKLREWERNLKQREAVLPIPPKNAPELGKEDVFDNLRRGIRKENVK